MDGIGFFCEKPSKFDENHILPSKIRRNSFIFVVVTMHDGVIVSDEKEGEYHEA